MATIKQWQGLAAAILLSSALLACGGGSGGASSGTPPAAIDALQHVAGAPSYSGNTAVDGMNWINFRRSQAGMPALVHNSIVDIAAQGHSDYQKTNNIVTHVQAADKPGYTGARVIDRLHAAGYYFAGGNSAYGEVISATSGNSGFYMAEELITAIYHRFVIFEPKFKEVGTGAATSASNYSYFTSDFTANGGFGPGLGAGRIVTWPASGQLQVPSNFLSDYESPDPVPDANEVGYPVSVHADLDAALTVRQFTLQPRGGAALPVRLLSHGTDGETPVSAAAIVPLAALRSGTTYDASFEGTVGGVPVSRNWSFTTR